MKGKNARAAERREAKRAQELKDMRAVAHQATGTAEGWLGILRKVQAVAGVEPDAVLYDLPEQVGRAMGLTDDEIEDRIVTAWRRMQPPRAVEKPTQVGLFTEEPKTT